MRQARTSRKRAWVCRLKNSHKRVRIQTPEEEAYECRTCGRLHLGPLHESKPPDFLGAFGGGNE